MQFKSEHFEHGTTETSRPNYITILQQDMVDAIQQALDEFNKRKNRLEQNQQRALMQEKERFELAIQTIDQGFQENQPSWSAYQKAKTKHTEDKQSENNAHAEKITDIESHYRLSIEKLTLEYRNETLQLEQHFKQKQAENEKFEDERSLSRKYDTMIGQANATYQQEREKAFSHYQAMYKIEDQILHDAIPEARIESYRMIARAIGFDDIVLDSKTNKLGYDKRYEVIQPLLSHLDLRQALLRDIKTNPFSDLIRIFAYSLHDNAALGKIVQSLDFSFNSQLFRHKCLFITPPKTLERNTLYIQLGERDCTCTLLCPYGTVLQKTYNATSNVGYECLRIYFESGRIPNHIEQNCSYFVADLYYGNKAGGFDAFTHLIDTVDGFKSHVSHSIFTYNKYLVASSGLLQAYLTQQHLFRSGCDHHIAYETTPFHFLKIKHNEATSAARLKYEALLLDLKNKYTHAIEEAEKWLRAAKTTPPIKPQPASLSISQASRFCIFATSNGACHEKDSGGKPTSAHVNCSESNHTTIQNGVRKETSSNQSLATITESLTEDKNDSEDFDDYSEEITKILQSSI